MLFINLQNPLVRQWAELFLKKPGFFLNPAHRQHAMASRWRSAEPGLKRATARPRKHSCGALYWVVSGEWARILNTFIHSLKKRKLNLLKNCHKIADND